MRAALRRPIAVGMAAACTMSVSAHTIGGSGDRLSSSRILFFGDLDGTLLGGAPELATFCEHWLTIERPSGSMLAYNTGRCYTQYCQGMNSGLPGMHLGGALRGVLPTPDVLITGDGTEVRWLVDRASADMSIDTEWRARIREHWWSSGLRAAVIARMAADDQGIIPDLNSPANTDLPGGEARHAITLADAAQARRLCADLQCEFSRSGVTFYTLDGWGQPKPTLIVAIPSIAGKANAAHYVRAKLGFESSECVAAGDSSNDASMLEAGMPFIVVANASEDLLEQAAAKPSAQHHYRASGSHASGCVEGLLHFRSVRVR